MLFPGLMLASFTARHAFNCLTYIKKYADSGTRTNTVRFPRLLLERVQLPGLHKKHADNGTRTSIVRFPRLLLACIQLPGQHKEMCVRDCKFSLNLFLVNDTGLDGTGEFQQYNNQVNVPSFRNQH